MGCDRTVRHVIAGLSEMRERVRRGAEDCFGLGGGNQVGSVPFGLGELLTLILGGQIYSYCWYIDERRRFGFLLLNLLLRAANIYTICI
jgi:hypothetical protein